MSSSDRVSRTCLAMAAGLVLVSLSVGHERQKARGDEPPRFAGPLAVHPKNPRYFADGGGKAIYLTGAHTWNNFQHNDVYPRVAFDEYLDFLKRHRHNFIRLWVFEHGAWDPWSKGPARVEPVRYARTGPGNALDGKAKYDLTRFDGTYFERLRARVTGARERGIYVSVMLFQGWSVEKKGQTGNPWLGHPLNGANNINGVNGDLNGDGEGLEIHTLQAPPQILQLQQAYVRKVIDAVNDLDNVLYEIGNEMHAGSIAWQYRMIQFVRAYEKTKPKQHPVGMTGAPIANAALFDSPADWVSPTGDGGYSTDPPPADGRKVIVADVDHIWPTQYRQWVWKSFTRGLNPAFMDLYGATKIGDHDVKEFTFVGDWVGQHETVRKNLGYTSTYAHKMNLAEMTPRGDLASTGYALANPGTEYLVYQPKSEEAFSLTLRAGAYHCEWFNPATGENAGGGSVQAAAGARQFKAPFAGEAVLYLRASTPEKAGREQGTPSQRFTFKHHFIDTTLPVYKSPNGWLVGDYGGAALADFDGDGDLDFAFNRAPSGGGPQMFYWYEYQAPDRWVRHDAARDFTTALGAAVLDVDRDGWTDILGGQSWYRNPGKAGGKEFQRMVYDPKGGGEHDIILADIDGDGQKDVVTLYDQTGLHWYRLPGFQKRTVVPADPKGLLIHGGVSPGGAGDLDGDGDVDLFRTNMWVENLDGKGTQWAQHPVPFHQTPRNNLVSVRSWIADLDRDGDNDIVTSDCDWMTHAKIRWLENVDGRGRKWTEHTIGQGLDFHSLIAADFDGDGDLDLFTCDQEQGSGGYKWYLFENADGKAGSFTRHVLLDRALGGHEVQVGDVDGDGDLDLVSKLWGPARDNALAGKMHVDYLENLAVSSRGSASGATKKRGSR